jgi:peptidoglycan-associated lipoprotein
VAAIANRSNEQFWAALSAGPRSSDNDHVMSKHASAVVAVVALATIVLAGLRDPASADARRIRAFVYPDRGEPGTSVVVEDFRVNETVWDEGGVQYVWVRGAAGNFKLPLHDIRQIEVVTSLGLFQTDWARFAVKVTALDETVYTGSIDIRVLRGVAEGAEWYYYPATQRDRGTRLWRIVLGSDRIPPTIPLAEPVQAEQPVPVVAPTAVPAPAAPSLAVPPPAAPSAAVPAPAAPSEDDMFARLSLEELNAQMPLGDVFFDFDLADVRPDAEAVLQRNAAWLNRWPTTVVRVGGYADVRGTREYNLGLGQQRAERTRAFLISLGVPATRISVVSRGESEAFCAEQTENCWARNRRAHFVITAK